MICQKEAQGSGRPDQDHLLSLAVEAYLFGFASVEMFRTMDDLARAERNGLGLDFNRFTHARRLAASDSKWLAAPNTEMLYSNAWLDLSQGPVLLEIPDMGSRYYVVQLLDFFANSHAHLGSRTLGNRGGRLVISGPGWSGQVPEGLTVLESPTSFAWILARIHVRDGEALPAVNALQDQLEVAPLRASGQALAVGERWPRFRNRSAIDFFVNLDQVLRRNPPRPGDAGWIARLRQLGLLGDQSREADAIDPGLRGILERAVAIGQQRIAERESQFENYCPGWIWEGLSAGSGARDHLSRAASAKAGLGILCAEEAIYPLAYVDAQGQPLDGRCSYRLSFSPQELPQAKYFWWVTVYELPDYRLVANSLSRYVWGSVRGRMEPAADGKFELLLQPDCPAGSSSNWLPTPAEGKFAVALRVFGPSQAMLTRRHRLPRVVRL